MRLPTQLLLRKINSHKGDFGHTFVLGGSAQYSGAGVLCAEAAMRSGAGLVTLGIPRNLNNAIIKIKSKEVITFPLPQTKEGSLSQGGYKKLKDFLKKIDVLVIGPGLSQNKSTQALIRKLIIKIDKPLVIDADGLNALVGHLETLTASRFAGSRQLWNGTSGKRYTLLALRDPASSGMARQENAKILTPHPGEMAKLLGIGIKELQNKRKEITQNFARVYKVIVVLKGHNTIVADYLGNLYVNKTGNPGMATAGSGDVLTGIIAAFLGQGLNGFESAKYATYLHGLAGDLAAKEKTQISLIASDILAKIPEAIKLASSTA